ncbi:MAG TPA: hypothetical protein VFL67_00270 [Mycobacterium sp.]|nr:hypothetical protein [Mycobacterium sp.]
MSDQLSAATFGRPVNLHPSVGMWMGPEGLNARQKVAAIAKVRCLEHDLFEGGRIRRGLGQKAVEDLLEEINDLRAALGWLELDLEGHVGRSQVQRIASGI